MTKEGFPVTALREISVLLSLSHENVVSVREMVVGSSFDKVFMVMEVSNNVVGLVLFLLYSVSHRVLLSRRGNQLLVYGNGFKGRNEQDWPVALSTIRTKEHVASDSLGDKSYSSKVAVAS